MKGDHIEYTVEGIDPASTKGAFTISRRFSDFYALRLCFINRFPGLYVPPIAKKKSIGHKDAPIL
jgi:hypothetical protein